MDHLDVKGAFLNALLLETNRTIISIPSIPGVVAANGQTFRVVNSLFGQKHALNLWYEKISHAFSL